MLKMYIYEMYENVTMRLITLQSNKPSLEEKITFYP